MGTKTSITTKAEIAVAAAVLLVIVGFGISWWLGKLDDAQYSTSTSNLYNIGQAVSSYEDDHNYKLPPTDSMQHFQAALAPYVGGARGEFLFVQPENSQAYILNTALSNKTLASVKDPASVILMRGTVKHRNGRYAVLHCVGW